MEVESRRVRLHSPKVLLFSEASPEMLLFSEASPGSRNHSGEEPSLVACTRLAKIWRTAALKRTKSPNAVSTTASSRSRSSRKEHSVSVLQIYR